MRKKVYENEAQTLFLKFFFFGSDSKGSYSCDVHNCFSVNSSFFWRIFNLVNKLRSRKSQFFMNVIVERPPTSTAIFNINWQCSSAEIIKRNLMLCLSIPCFFLLYCVAFFKARILTLFPSFLRHSSYALRGRVCVC